jgi:hypothetical protein
VETYYVREEKRASNLHRGGRCNNMGLADRDYMKAGYRFERKREEKPSLFKRFKFFLWRIRRALSK